MKKSGKTDCQCGQLGRVGGNAAHGGSDREFKPHNRSVAIIFLESTLRQFSCLSVLLNGNALYQKVLAYLKRF